VRRVSFLSLRLRFELKLTQLAFPLLTAGSTTKKSPSFRGTRSLLWTEEERILQPTFCSTGPFTRPFSMFLLFQFFILLSLLPELTLLYFFPNPIQVGSP